MTKKEIAQMKKDIALRPLKRAFRLYGYEAGRTLVGGILFAGFGAGIFMVAGILL